MNETNEAKTPREFKDIGSYFRDRSRTVVLRVPSPTEGLIMGIDLLVSHGTKTQSRNGPVLTYNGPVVTEYITPSQRLLTAPQRDANPFFHLFESCWMLMGRNDIGFLTRYAKNMANYSVDGVTQHAAYGHRWFSHFDMGDQVTPIVEKLRAAPDTRQCVIQIWDSNVDLVDTEENSKDRPCNTTMVFSPRRQDDGSIYLDMMVTNRSNDIVWGAYGANVVHFSFLHHLVADLSGMEVGVYRQVSDNYHMYTAALYGEKLHGALTQTNPESKNGLSLSEGLMNVYQTEVEQPEGFLPGDLFVSHYNDYMVSDGETIGKGSFNHWFRGFSSVNSLMVALEETFDEKEYGPIVDLVASYSDHALLVRFGGFFTKDFVDSPEKTSGLIVCVVPAMLLAYELYKKGHGERALQVLEVVDIFIRPHLEFFRTLNPAAECEVKETSPCQCDWLHAGHLWIQRRLKNRGTA